MLDASSTVEWFRRAGARFFAGVPDSLLKEFCAYLEESVDRSHHVITANEGGAVAFAAGHHLATGEVPVVYLQNSGLGNTINPLLSLADPAIYALPMVLLIGWRGEPGLHDEPQHLKQGRVMLAMLDAMEIPYRVLSVEPTAAESDVSWAVTIARTSGGPVALVVRKGAFAETKREAKEADGSAALTREAAIELPAGALGAGDVIVSTTGMASRELYEVRARRGEPARDFLTVGSMGHASSIACAIARARPGRQVFCFDGDGAFLMHMGSAAIHAAAGSANFKHILLNNGCHDSVGGQPTVAFQSDLTSVAAACGYATLPPVWRSEDVLASVERLRAMNGPALLEIRIRSGARSNLGRPSSSPRENKEAFVAFLSKS